MNKLTISVAALSGTFLLGQYSIIKAYDVSVLEDNTVQLGNLSYQYGCNKAKYLLDDTSVDCKAFAASYKEVVEKVIKVKGFSKE